RLGHRLLQSLALEQLVLKATVHLYQLVAADRMVNRVGKLRDVVAPLDNVLVRPELQGGDRRMLVTAGGENHKRHQEAAGFCLTQQIKGSGFRRGEIRENEIERPLLQELQRAR